MTDSSNAQVTIAIIGSATSIIVALIGAFVGKKHAAKDNEGPRQNFNGRGKITFTSILAVGLAITALAMGTMANRVSTITGSVVPRGTIVAWSKQSGEIPPGWAECNGSRGTPDLRNRFLRGVATIEEAGRTGGGETHTHSFSGITTNSRPPGNDSPSVDGNRERRRGGNTRTAIRVRPIQAPTFRHMRRWFTS